LVLITFPALHDMTVLASVSCVSIDSTLIPEGICVMDGLGNKHKTCNQFLPPSPAPSSDDGDTKSSVCLVGPQYDAIREQIGYDLVAGNRSFVPTLEIHDWTAHAIQTTMFRILLQEMLAYDTVRVIYEPNQSLYLERAADESCLAINLEIWHWTPTPEDEVVLSYDFLGAIGRETLYVPDWLPITSSNYQILLEGLAFSCPGGPQEFEVDTVSAYSVFPPVGTTNLTAIYNSTDKFPCNDNTPTDIQWTESRCTNGSYVPPQCANGSLCFELYMADPIWSMGWFEAMVRNLQLKFTPVYLGRQVLLDTVEQFHAEGRGLVYYWWEPHPLHLKFPSKSFITPEFSAACWETYTREPETSGVNCERPSEPIQKIIPRQIQARDPDLYHLWKSFTVSSSMQVDMMSLQGPDMGGAGILTVEQAACEWLRNNSHTWQSWLSIELPSKAAASQSGKKGLRRMVILFIILLVSFATLLVVAVFLLWRRNTLLAKRLLATSLEVPEWSPERPFLDLESPINKAITTIDDILNGQRSVSHEELKQLKTLLSTADNEPKLGDLLESTNSYYPEDAIKFIMDMSGQQNVPRTSPSNFNRCISKETSRSSSDKFVVDRHRNSQVWSFECVLPAGVLTPPFVLQDLQQVEQVGLGESFVFDTIQLSAGNLGKQLVITAMYFMHTKLGLVERLGLDEEKLVAFLKAVEQGYSRVNPYHNNTHAADVTQRFVTLVTKSDLVGNVFGDLEILAGVLAAILHDLHHPGTTNNFQVQVSSPVAQQFNDQHVLENQSLYLGLGLLEPGKSTDFLEAGLLKEQRSSLRSTVIALVLGTDMQEHFNIMSAFKAKVMTRGAVPHASPGSGLLPAPRPRASRHPSFTSEEKLLILKMGLKCADIGHVTLPPDVHLLWVRSLQEEFFKQGDIERRNKMPISFLCDKKKPRNGPACGENQLGFIDVICEPMYKSWVKMFPECGELLENLKTNRRYWEDDSKSHREGTFNGADIVVSNV